MHIYPLPAFASDSDWPRRSLAATIDYLGNFDAGGLSSVEIVADASYTFRGLGRQGFQAVLSVLSEVLGRTVEPNDFEDPAGGGKRTIRRTGRFHERLNT